MKSTKEWFEFFSYILLFVGLLLTILSLLPMELSEPVPTIKEYLPLLNMATYPPSFLLLYLSRKFRIFMVYPPFLVYTRDEIYTVIPWQPETETRWKAKLTQLKITVSKSINITELQVLDYKLISKGEVAQNDFTRATVSKRHGKTIYTFDFKTPMELDINTMIKLKISRDENVDELRPFLEYEVKYKSVLPVTFKYSRRIL